MDIESIEDLSFNFHASKKTFKGCLWFRYFDSSKSLKLNACITILIPRSLSRGE